MSLATWNRFALGAELLCNLRHFAWWHWARQCGTDTPLQVSSLYSSLSCCSGSLYNFLLLGFRQWPSRADRDLTLNMNIRRPLFRTWSRARCPHSDTEVRAWSLAVHHDGHHCSDGRASEEMSQKCWAHELSKILEYNSQHCILEYNGQRWGSLTSPRKVQTASGS